VRALPGRVIAVVLTGYDRDATDGVQAVRLCGGTVIAQDEASCQSFGKAQLFGWQAAQWRVAGNSSSRTYGMSMPQAAQMP
jgi:chemotaxis response regulator CheB